MHFWEKCFKTQASKTRVLIKFHLLKQKKQDFFRKPGMHPEVQYPKVSQVSRGTAATRPRTTLSTWTGWKSPQHHGRTVCVFVCFHTAFFRGGKIPVHGQTSCCLLVILQVAPKCDIPTSCSFSLIFWWYSNCFEVFLLIFRYPFEVWNVSEILKLATVPEFVSRMCHV